MRPGNATRHSIPKRPRWGIQLEGPHEPKPGALWWAVLLAVVLMILALLGCNEVMR